MFFSKYKIVLLIGIVVTAALAMEPRTKPEIKSPAQADRLKKDVVALTSTKKPRNHSQPEGLEEAAKYIRTQWENLGLKVEDQNFTANKKPYKNVLTSFGPSEGPRIIVGAHYDVDGDLPGADDNASGVAGLLELARLLKERSPTLEYRLDLVAYSLEEQPFFGGAEMGSAVHAKSLKDQGVKVELMMSLEMIGYFTDKEDSQVYPSAALKLLYPKKGNFIGVVGEWKSPLLTQKVGRLLRENSKIEVHSLAAPPGIQGIDLSDHRSYWQEGYSAVMITDTAFFRNPNYHKASDTPDTLDYSKMSEVVEGVYGIVTRF